MQQGGFRRKRTTEERVQDKATRRALQAQIRSMIYTDTSDEVRIEPFPRLAFCLARCQGTSFVNRLLVEASWGERYAFLCRVLVLFKDSSKDSGSRYELADMFGYRVSKFFNKHLILTYQLGNHSDDELVRGWLADNPNPKKTLLDNDNLFFTITSKNARGRIEIVRRLQLDLQMQVHDRSKILV